MPEDEEFSKYLELLRVYSSSRYRDAIFVGLEDERWRPMFVDRSIFSRHGYILGAPGERKTSSAIAQLLLQLGCEELHADGGASGPPILIIDCKPQGERFLRNFAERIAERRGQRLGFFSTNPEYASLWFDPMQCVSPIADNKGKAQTFLKALSLVHPESQDAVFFMNEQRVVIERAFSASPPPRTLQELVDRVEVMTRGKGGNREARGAHGALQELCGAPHVRVDGSPVQPQNVVDFERLLEQTEIVYLHLDTEFRGTLSKALGKLAIYSLLLAAQRRRELGKPTRQAYVFIDEFHKLAAANVVDLLTVCRDAGIAMILAHQSSSSLVSRDADLFSTLFEVTAFQQYFSLEDESIIRKLEKVSSRVSDWVRSESKTFGGSRGQSVTNGTSWSSVGGNGQSQSFGVSEGVTWSSTQGRSEHKIAGLTPELVAKVNGTRLLTVTRVRGEDASALTPTGSLPVPLQLLPVVPSHQYHALSTQPWPAAEKPPPRESSTPPPGRAPAGAHRPSRGPTPAQPKAEPPPRPSSDLLERLRRLGDSLRPHMIRENPAGTSPPPPGGAKYRSGGHQTVNQVAQSFRRKIKDVVECARACGIDVDGGSDVLTPEQVAAVVAALKA